MRHAFLISLKKLKSSFVVVDEEVGWRFWLMEQVGEILKNATV